MKTSEKILQYITEKKQVTVHELVDYLEISRMAVSKQLSNLISEGKINKTGKPPKVFYFIAAEKDELEKGSIKIDPKIKNIIEKNFLLITPFGQRLEGLEGFIYWCRKTNQSIEKSAGEYADTWKKYDKFKKSGLIDGMEKFKQTFKTIYLDKVFYLDFYSIERFGKTKLGQLLLYAKQSQNRKLIKELTQIIKPQLDHLLKKFNIDGIGFIPPTVKREVQFMKELEKNLHPDLKKVSIVKVQSDIMVPQKTLNKLKDRVENAKRTIVVDESRNFENILLVDDAIGSGATLNETAEKIRARGICRGKIIGLSITGSFKGFDVINEV